MQKLQIKYEQNILNAVTLDIAKGGEVISKIKVSDVLLY